LAHSKRTAPTELSAVFDEESSIANSPPRRPINSPFQSVRCKKAKNSKKHTILLNPCLPRESSQWMAYHQGQLINIRQQIPHCHSQPFDLHRACPERLDLRTSSEPQSNSSSTGPDEGVNSAKDLEIRRPAIRGTPQNDTRKSIFWTGSIVNGICHRHVEL
jgi:hypothetical protein